MYLVVGFVDRRIAELHIPAAISGRRIAEDFRFAWREWSHWVLAKSSCILRRMMSLYSTVEPRRVMKPPVLSTTAV